MLGKKLFILAVLSITIGVVITAYVGITLMKTSNPTTDTTTNAADSDNSGYPASNSSVLAFHERWIFKATLDRAVYNLGMNMTLNVQMTCLIDHNVTDYNPGWLRWVEIRNNSDDVVWHPIRDRPERFYPIYEFSKGYEMGGTQVFHLGTTEERPVNTTFEVNHWIPALPPGNYYFIVRLPPGVALSSDHVSSIRLPFEIE